MPQAIPPNDPHTVFTMIKHTLFASEHALENAEIMLDACREEYERAGRANDAQALKGLELSSPASAQLALMTVSTLPEDASVADVRRYTLAAIRQAYVHLIRQTKLAS